MLVPGIMLKIGIRHERYHAVKDRGREEHCLAVGVERHKRLERQNNIAENEQDSVEEKQGTYVLHPVLGTAVQAFFEPPHDRQRPVFPVHDPGHVAAQGECDDSRSGEERKGKQPGLHKHCFSSLGYPKRSRGPTGVSPRYLLLNQSHLSVPLSETITEGGDTSIRNATRFFHKLSQTNHILP